MPKIDMSMQACIRLDGQTLPKTTLFNALLDIQHHPHRLAARVDVQGHTYAGPELDQLLRSPEFAAHRDQLKERGKVRD